MTVSETRVYRFRIDLHANSTHPPSLEAVAGTDKPRERKPSTSSSSSAGDNDIHSDESDHEAGGGSSSKSKLNLDYIQQFFADKLRLNKSTDDAGSSSILKTVDFAGIIDHWKENGFKKIVTMVGAGISTCK